MARRFETLAQLLDHGFDTVIDVRSPAEFAEDRIPGAINLPVLNDDERARVGTIYTQDSPFLARKIGAALVFRNAADHVAGALADRPGGWRPLVYCWRGGQRSGAFGWMLREIGWRAETIEGGYRTYRRLVHAALYDGTLPHRIVLIDGFTGTAKTQILQLVAGRGGQVIDLEGLARHRGSLLGARPGGQPGQKSFESALAGILAGLDTSRPVLVEAESNKIGELLVPPALWAAMKSAPRIEMRAPIAARAAYLDRAYDDILSDGPRLKDKLVHLRQLRGRETIERWFQLIDEGRRVDLTRALMEEHYDPAYAKSRSSIGAGMIGDVGLTGLDPSDLEAAAARVLSLMDGR